MIETLLAYKYPLSLGAILLICVPLYILIDKVKKQSSVQLKKPPATISTDEISSIADDEDMDTADKVNNILREIAMGINASDMTDDEIAIKLRHLKINRHSIDEAVKAKAVPREASIRIREQMRILLSEATRRHQKVKKTKTNINHNL